MLLFHHKMAKKPAQKTQFMERFWDYSHCSYAFPQTSSIKFPPLKVQTLIVIYPGLFLESYHLNDHPSGEIFYFLAQDGNGKAEEKMM